MSVTDKLPRAQPLFHGGAAAAARSPADPRVSFFDHHAPTWDQNGDDLAVTLKRLETLRGRLALASGQEVLELGCGTGRLTAWVVDCVRPGRVTAADFSPAMLARAQARNAASEFWLLDICAPPPARDRFDVVFCFHAFPHFRDQLQALKHIAQLLKPGGRLIILHLVGRTRLNHFHAQLAHPVNHDRLPAREEWLALLNSANLRLDAFVDEPDLFLLDATALKCCG